jgi:hypothetical protein
MSPQLDHVILERLGLVHGPHIAEPVTAVSGFPEILRYPARKVPQVSHIVYNYPLEDRDLKFPWLADTA